MKILVLVLICLHLSEGVERCVWGFSLTVNFSPKGASQARVEQRPSPADLMERQADCVLVHEPKNHRDPRLEMDDYDDDDAVCMCVCVSKGGLVFC